MKVSEKQIKEMITRLVEQELKNNDLNEGWLDAIKGGGQYVAQAAKNFGGVKQAAQSASKQADANKVYDQWKLKWKEANQLAAKYNQYRKMGVYAQNDPKNPQKQQTV